MAQAKKVLLVDDDRVQLAAVSAWLTSEGYEVITHDSPFGTGRVLLREQPDVVLLDVEMPGLEGQTLAETLRKDGKFASTRIIFYSGKEEAVLQKLVRELNVTGAIRKTMNGRQFLAQFKRLAGPSPSPTR